MNRGLVALLLIVTTASCGHRAALIPPLPRRPSTPTSTQLRQRGDQLEIRANYRLALLSERPVAPPVAAVLMVFPVASREAAAPLMGERTVREFEAGAATVPIAPLPDAALGKAVLRRDSLGVDQLGKAEAFVVAVALQDRHGASLPTRRTVFLPLTPPLPSPPLPTIDLRETGVHLTWTVPDDARIKQLHVYRWKDGAQEPAIPWRSLDTQTHELIDDEARFGDRLIYAFTTAAEAGEVPVESLAVTTGVIDYKDAFPPLLPRDLDALPESARIRVLWYPGGSADEAGVQIERQEQGQDSFVRVGIAAAGDAMYVDTSVTTGGHYRYRLVAVDKSGNEAAPTPPSEWVTPRPAP